MLRPLVVLWLAAPALLPEHRTDIADWTRARSRRPVFPEAAAPSPPYDAAMADEVEHLLEEARTSAPSERDSLERLEQLLSAHPELPQAAWWMAERHAMLAQWSSEDAAVPAAEGPSPSATLAARARKLEGERAMAFGHAPLELGPVHGSPLTVTGARPGDRVVIDGLDVAEHPLFETGRHHVQTFRGGRRLWAAWVELGSPAELIIVDPTPPCSELDLTGTTTARSAPSAPAGVLCGEWVAARPAGGGGTEFSSCHGSECTPWERWPRRGALDGSVLVRDDGASLPSWFAWTAVGLGAAAATGLVLWRAGAFESEPPSTEFVFTGPAAAVAF